MEQTSKKKTSGPYSPEFRERAVRLAERHVSRQLRLAYLAPEVLKRLTCGREASAVSLHDLCFTAVEALGGQVGRAVGE